MFREPDVYCFSHHSWDPDRRAHDLLSRCARDRRVFFIGPPVADTECVVDLEVRRRDEVSVCTLHVPVDLETRAIELHARHLVNLLVERHRTVRPVVWYETPQALPYSHHLHARAVVYDRAQAATEPPAPNWLEREELLLTHADVVFTYTDRVGRDDVLVDGATDRTWREMWALVAAAIAARTGRGLERPSVLVSAGASGGAGATAFMRRLDREP